MLPLLTVKQATRSALQANITGVLFILKYKNVLTAGHYTVHFKPWPAAGHLQNS